MDMIYLCNMTNGCGGRLLEFLDAEDIPASAQKWTVADITSAGGWQMKDPFLLPVWQFIEQHQLPDTTVLDTWK